MRLEGAIFYCDQARCEASQAVPGEELADQYLRLVQDFGWRVTNHPQSHRQHYCPEHKERS